MNIILVGVWPLFLWGFLCRHIEEGIISEEFHLSFCRMEWWLKSCSSCVLFSSRTPVDRSSDGLLGFQETSMIGFDFENSGRSSHIYSYNHMTSHGHVEWLGKKVLRWSTFSAPADPSTKTRQQSIGFHPLSAILTSGKDMIPFGLSNERLNHQLRYGPKNR